MHRAALSYQATPATLTDDEVVRTWGHLIDRAARRIAARTANAVTAADLWSSGALGLIDAYRRFDATRAIRFESFAEHRIRGAMIDELRELDHLPRRLRADADRVRKARTELGTRLGREPSSEELAAAVGMTLEELDAVESVAQPAVPISPELKLVSVEPAQDTRLEHAGDVFRLTKAIGRLPERLALVLSLHYVEGLTYKEIAHALEVSEARICQLHGEAVKKLRADLTTEEAR